MTAHCHPPSDSGGLPSARNGAPHPKPDTGFRSWLLRLTSGCAGPIAVLDQGTVSLCNFLTALLIGRFAGKSELGTYAIAFAVATGITELSAALTSTPYAIFGPQMTLPARRRYLGTLLLQQLTLSGGLSALVLLGLATAAYVGRATPGSAIITAATVLALLNVREFCRRAFYAELAVHFALALDALACVGQICGLLILSRLGHLNAANVYLLIGSVSAIYITAWMVHKRANLKFDISGLWKATVENWAASKWVFASVALWMVATYFYPLLLAVFHGTAITGVWAACSTIVGAVNPIFGGLGNYVTPHIASSYATNGPRTMRRYVYLASTAFTAVLAPFVVAIVVFGDRILILGYGPGFAGNGYITALLTLNLLVTVITYPVSRGLITIRAARTDMAINVISVMALFSVGITAIKLFALAGAATALLLSSVLTAALRIVAFERTAGRLLVDNILPNPPIETEPVCAS